MTAAPSSGSDTPHVPVLLESLLAAVAPVTGRWLDGTFGAGGYTRGLLEAGADQVIAGVAAVLLVRIACGQSPERLKAQYTPIGKLELIDQCRWIVFGLVGNSALRPDPGDIPDQAAG